MIVINKFTFILINAISYFLS